MTTDENFPNELVEALASVKLVRLRPYQSGRELECRTLYLSPGARDWVIEILPSLESDGYVPDASSPEDQLGVLVDRYCLDDEFPGPQPHLMRPPGSAIWRLRTADLRIAGWLCDWARFVVSEIELKARTIGNNRNRALLETAMRLRVEPRLDNPNFDWETLDDCR